VAAFPKGAASPIGSVDVKHVEPGEVLHEARRFIFWFVLGVPAFVIVIGIFYLMVAKPLSLVTS